MKNNTCPENSVVPDLINTYKPSVCSLASACGCYYLLADRRGTVIFASDHTGNSSELESNIICPYFPNDFFASIHFKGEMPYFKCRSGLLFSVGIIYAEGDFICATVAGPFTDVKSTFCDISSAYCCRCVDPIPLSRYSGIAYLQYLAAVDMSCRSFADKLEYDGYNRQRAEISARMQNAYHGIRSDYPVAYEKELKLAVMSGNKALANENINRLLADIFYSADSAKNMDIMLTRILELLTIISRAAIDGGMEPSVCLDLNVSAVSQLMEKRSHFGTPEDVAYWLVNIVNNYASIISELSSAKHSNLLSRAKSYIMLNYTHKITLNDVASAAFISPAYISKVFKRETGMTFVAYLNSLRIEQAKYYLLFTDRDISDIYSLTGFEDQSYFTKVFKSFTGISPGKYRERRGLFAPNN